MRYLIYEEIGTVVIISEEEAVRRQIETAPASYIGEKYEVILDDFKAIHFAWEPQQEDVREALNLLGVKVTP